MSNDQHDLYRSPMDLFAALESAAGYISAGATAEHIADLDSPTEEQWARLDEIYWKNDQLYTRRAAEPDAEAHVQMARPRGASTETESNGGSLGFRGGSGV
jgi:hypothetical protein